MALYIDDKTKIDINQLKDYTGTDEVMKLLAESYQDVYRRFFDESLPVTFLHPKMKKGETIKQGTPARAQENLPWTCTIPTRAGDRRLRYCVSAIMQPNGGFDFRPTSMPITLPIWDYGVNDIDKILFLMQSPKFKDRTIFIRDIKDDETKRAEKRGRSAIVEFHIFSDGGDLFNNEKKLDQFCLAWGISVKSMRFENQKKNALADAIEVAELKRDNGYGYEAFKQALKDNDPYFEIRGSVQDAIDKEIIKWDSKKYQVQFANNEVLLKVPIGDSNVWKNTLFEYLSKNPDALDTVQVFNDTAPTHGHRKVELSDTLTEDSIKALAYFDKRELWREISGLNNNDLKKMKATEFDELLIDHYITKGLLRP